MKVAVVIPFFQRHPGLLTRAVSSIIDSAGLSNPASTEVIIVDDQSPISAESELTSLQYDNHRISLRVISQKNKGPGAARNSGLDGLGKEVDIVAFLDSDDTWSSDHLERICQCFENGADFYFADHQRSGEPMTRFCECEVRPEQHEQVGSDLYAYKDELFTDILKRSPVGTSTVAFRYEKYKDLRFSPDIHAGEDIMFWLDIAHQSPRAIFSTRIEANYGRGVNIFHGVEWGTTTDLKRLRDSTLFHLKVAQRFALTEQEHTINQKQLRELALAFANSLAGAIRHREKGYWPIARNYARLNPILLKVLPMECLKLAHGYLKASDAQNFKS